MTSFITQARIVAHALAVWNDHSGSLTQADKDFFDKEVLKLDRTKPELELLGELITARLEQRGLRDDAAITESHRLVARYAKRWGREMAPLVKQDAR